MEAVPPHHSHDVEEAEDTELPLTSSTSTSTTTTACCGQAGGGAPALFVKEDREEVVERAVRLGEELAGLWNAALLRAGPSLSARVRPGEEGVLDPYAFFTSVLRRPRLVLAPMVSSSSHP